MDTVKVDPLLVKKTPKVSVCVITYNQEKYIQQCLDSILSQKTSFYFEIIVHDDASQDNTPKIIEEYFKKHPDVIVPVLQKENCYSKNKQEPILNCANFARSNYLAICEGDDYWINDKKLETQFHILEKNPEATLTVSPGQMELNGVQLKKLHCWYGDKACIFSAQDVLNISNQFAPTASYFLRREILINALTVFDGAPISDLFIEVYAGIRGDIIYHPEIFSTYRLFADSSWSLTMTKDRISNIQKYISEMQAVIHRFEAGVYAKKLNWDKKLATMYYGLAIACLEERQYVEFSAAIENSIMYAEISFKQKILFIVKKIRMESFFAKIIFTIKKVVK